jgi:diguanylate cyclase (GGDEF)-like protein
MKFAQQCLRRFRLGPEGGSAPRANADGWLSFSDDPDLVLAQYAALRRQIPLLYLLLMIIAAAVWYIFLDHAPLVLITSVCGVFVILSGLRFVIWVWFSPSPAEISAAEARSILRRTTLAVIPICIAYLSYAFLMDQYGGPYERAGLAVCVVLTAIGCIFCLTHLPQASRMVHLLTMGPYVAFHVIQGNPAFILVALNAAIVTTLLLRVAQNAFDGFTELVTSRAQLATQQIEAQRLASENASLAMTDPLTGLPNRRLFLEQLEKQVQASEVAGKEFVIGVLDLNRFKPVNDVYGHAIGDLLLIEVGRRLQSLAGDNMLVARLGGDEFGLLLNDGTDFASAIGEQIIDQVTGAFEIDGHTFSLGCSIGLALFPSAGRTASALFHCADYALYDAKGDSRSGFTYFTPELERRQRAETELEEALLKADLQHELAIEFQPIVCLHSGRVIALEALGRWESPAVGKVEPAVFINAAERLNLMGEISTILFGKLLHSIPSLPKDLEIAFNLSTHDIATTSTIAKLIAAIEDHDVDARRIVFEITETSLMQDFTTAIDHIRMLRGLGASIALDDFGTGFSSLSYLNNLPIDRLKIDRSFVGNLDRESACKIVAAIIGMCETLGMQCIVEGVETAQQCRALQSLGCSVAQGFLFARPMAVDAMKDWLASDHEPALRMRMVSGQPRQSEFKGLKALNF